MGEATGATRGTAGAAGEAARPGRMPTSLRALGGVGVVAIAAMALAPQLGSLLPHDDFRDAIPPGTDGTAHYQSPESTRRVDGQLLGLAPAPAGVRAPSGMRVVAVRLRLAAGRAGDAVGCRVELWGAHGRLDQRSVGGSRCGDGMAGDGEREVVDTLLVAIPRDVKPTQVRVMWEPPAYLALPAV